MSFEGRGGEMSADRKAWLGLALLACSPLTAGADLQDLAGAWAAYPEVDGRRATVGLKLDGNENGTLTATLVLPPIDAWNIPLGEARFENGRLMTALGEFAYDDTKDTLTGDLPAGLVPVHRIPIVLSRTERLAQPPESRKFGELVTPVWTFRTGAPVYGSPVIGKGTVYLGSDDGYLYSLESGTGDLQWKTATGGPIRARPTLGGGRIFVPSDDGRLYCLDQADGKIIWTTLTGTSPVPRSDPESEGYRYDHFSSAARVNDERVFVGTLDGDLVVLDRETGEENWRFKTGDAVVSTPALVGGKAVFGSFDNHVYALDAETGKLVWRFDTGAPVVSSPTIHDDRVIIGSRSYDLYGLQAADGSVDWRFYYWFSWVESSATLKDGIAYVGSSDSGMVFAIDAVTGREVWSFDTAGSPWGSPAVTDNRVYIGSVGVRGYFIPHEPGFYAIDRATGEPVWWYRVEHPESRTTAGFVSSPATDGKRVYVGGLDGMVYAFPTGVEKPR
ncbi:MAG: hypothetical protein AMJ59_25365 [Gammaproteobacteria bacterium SG8_31]|nr:MAG: hypothetical protein AMJ59_25365 [Gammaproteobacteria bacterium SG8_31]